MQTKGPHKYRRAKGDDKWDNDKRTLVDGIVNSSVQNRYELVSRAIGVVVLLWFVVRTYCCGRNRYPVIQVYFQYRYCMEASSSFVIIIAA
jgi:hypothetical protein